MLNMKFVLFLSLFILSSSSENHELIIQNALIQNANYNTIYWRSGISLGTVYFSKFKLLEIKSNNDSFNISIFYDTDTDNLIFYDRIKKQHPTVTIVELERVSDKKFIVADTLLTANLTDTLNFQFKQNKNNSFAILNSGFETNNYRVRKVEK